MKNKYGFEICPKCFGELPENKTTGEIGQCLKCTYPFEESEENDSQKVNRKV